MLADFKPDLLVSQVLICADSLIFQAFLNFLCIFGLPVGDTEDYRLHRRQPGRHQTGMVFDEDPDESFQGTQNRPVDHYRYPAVAFGCHIFSAQTVRHREIDCSEDFEVLEIVAPADFETRIVDAPADAAD